MGGGLTADNADIGGIPEAYEILTPAGVPGHLEAAVVYASPHSGRFYPPEFVAESALDALVLRRSEDSFVDQLFDQAPTLGSALIRAHFARVYLDVNREPYELDPAMFRDPLPAHSNTSSLRVVGGLGTIARVVADGAEVYRGKLCFAEAEYRLRRVYHPYHGALSALLGRVREHFGHAILIDCHSMPMIGGPMDSDGGARRANIVLGDRFGTSCAPALVDLAHSVLSGFGYSVGRNAPYAGGFTTQHYGQPANGIHALQIELNRGLYMDERRYTKSPEFSVLKGHLTQLIRALRNFDLKQPMAAE